MMAHRESPGRNVTNPVRIERDDAVLTITIDRAERCNPLNEAVAEGVFAGLDQAETLGGEASYGRSSRAQNARPEVVR